jgi:hypothetical protein
MDELDDGFEEFRVVQEGANVDGSEDSRAVRCKLQRWAEMVPCGTVEEIVGPSFGCGTTGVACRGGNETTSEAVGVELGEVGAKLREGRDVSAGGGGLVWRSKNEGWRRVVNFTEAFPRCSDLPQLFPLFQSCNSNASFACGEGNRNRRWRRKESRGFRSVIRKLIADGPDVSRSPEVGDPEVRNYSHRRTHQLVVLDGAKLPSPRGRGENSLETCLGVRDHEDLIRASN